MTIGKISDLLIAVALLAAPASGQDAVLRNIRSLLDGYKQNILAGAEKMPESDYAFKPAPEVFDFRGLLAHIGDANYSICSPLTGGENPNTNPLQKRMLDKASLIGLVGKSFEYCDSALASLNDAELSREITRGSSKRQLAWYALHELEHVGLHYGNMITYMRMKGLVPAETERRQSAAQPRQPSEIKAIIR